MSCLCWCVALRRLNLSGCWQVNSQQLQLVLSSATDLQTLSVKGCHQITDIALVLLQQADVQQHVEEAEADRKAGPAATAAASNTASSRRKKRKAAIPAVPDFRHIHRHLASIDLRGTAISNLGAAALALTFPALAHIKLGQQKCNSRVRGKGVTLLCALRGFLLKCQATHLQSCKHYRSLLSKKAQGTSADARGAAEQWCKAAGIKTLVIPGIPWKQNPLYRREQYSEDEDGRYRAGDDDFSDHFISDDDERAAYHGYDSDYEEEQEEEELHRYDDDENEDDEDDDEGGGHPQREFEVPTDLSPSAANLMRQLCTAWHAPKAQAKCLCRLGVAPQLLLPACCAAECLGQGFTGNDQQQQTDSGVDGGSANPQYGAFIKSFLEEVKSSMLSASDAIYVYAREPGKALGNLGSHTSALTHLGAR